MLVLRRRVNLWRITGCEEMCTLAYLLTRDFSVVEEVDMVTEDDCTSLPKKKR